MLNKYSRNELEYVGIGFEFRIDVKGNEWFFLICVDGYFKLIYIYLDLFSLWKVKYLFY